MPSTTRFTANVRVVKITEGEEYNNNIRKNVKVDEKNEVASITVRASTLDSLRTKLQKHVELIDE